MDKNISDIFDYGDEIVVEPRVEEMCDPEEIKELTMKRIHEGAVAPIEQGKRTKRARPAWRGALVAVVAAVLLAGTAFAVYQHTIRDAAIEDVPTRDSEIYEWKAGETETRLSLNGFADSPEYRAYVEWTDWNRAWNAAHPDPWGERGVDDSWHETPDNYVTYMACFAEQGEKLDEIAAKYGLTLLGEYIPFRTEYQLCRAIGAADLVADGYEIGGDYLFPNGAFKAVGDTVIDGKSVSFSIWNSVKGSFLPLSGVLPEAYTEWSYTTHDGTEILLMTDAAREESVLIAPLSGCYVTAYIGTDDAQTAQGFADAIDLRGLDALFATDSARAEASKTVAEYLAYRQTATTVDEIGEDEAAVLAYLGDWYPTALPEGVALDSMTASAPDHASDFYRVGRLYYGMNSMVEFFYRELAPLDGENDETRLQLSTYSGYYDLPEGVMPGWVNTSCTVGGYEAVLSEPNGVGAGDYELLWLDTDRQLLFRLGMYGAMEDAVMAAAESVAGVAPVNPPARHASTPEERFQNSLMPLGRVRLYAEDAIERSLTAKRLIAEFGNFELESAPEGFTSAALRGQHEYLFEQYRPGRADWSAVYRTYSDLSVIDWGQRDVILSWKRFDDGLTRSAFETDRLYNGEWFDITDCTVNGCEGYIYRAVYDEEAGITWLDTERELIFTVRTIGGTDFTDEAMLGLAEGVHEAPWRGDASGGEPDRTNNLGLASAEIVAAQGRYVLPGIKFGSTALTESVDAYDALWYMGQEPYAEEAVYTTYADGLMLAWQRTWADAARKAESSADSFAAIQKYLLACDDSGAVQTGLSVNGYDAICVSWPHEEFWGNEHTDLIWYDADAGLIFTLADYPDEDGASRTAAQLITLAESVTAE